MSFSSSPYASAAALLPSSSTALPHVDVAQPGALAAALRARAFRGELILFSFDFCGISEALSLLLTLRRIGFEHFLISKNRLIIGTHFLVKDMAKTSQFPSGHVPYPARPFSGRLPPRRRGPAA